MERLLERVRPRLESWVAARQGPALRSRVDREDLVQEILLKAYRALDRFDPREKRAFYGWLFEIARNTLLDWEKRIRAARRDVGREVPVHSGIHGRRTTPSAAAMRNEDRERMLVALAELPERYRVVIRLRRFENLSGEETAARLGTTPNNISVLLVRALRALRAKMS